MRLGGGFLLLALAVTALAQEKEPERRPLNLKLDNAGAWASAAPDPEQDKKGSLPGLGDDARPIPQAPPPKPEWGKSGPYPQDTNPLR